MSEAAPAREWRFYLDDMMGFSGLLFPGMDALADDCHGLVVLFFRRGGCALRNQAVRLQIVARSSMPQPLPKFPSLAMMGFHLAASALT